MMEGHEEAQLTLDVGGDEPEAATFRLTGALAVRREVRMGETIGVHVIGADGELIAEGQGEVTTVLFRRRGEAQGRPWTERVHGVTLS